MRVWTLLANSLGHPFLIVTFRRWPQEEELRNLKYMATCVESQSLNETTEAKVFQDFQMRWLLAEVSASEESKPSLSCVWTAALRGNLASPNKRQFVDCAVTNFGRNYGVMDNAFAQRVATTTLLRLSLFKRPVARWESVIGVTWCTGVFRPSARVLSLSRHVRTFLCCKGSWTLF